MVGGEKAAAAAQRLYPTLVVVTSPGGSQAAEKADWTPLAGRNVVLWPDLDEPGQRYAEAVARLIRPASLRILDAAALARLNPAGGAREPATGWDAADAERDWSGRIDQLKAAIRPLLRVMTEVPAEPSPVETLSENGQNGPRGGAQRSGYSEAAPGAAAAPCEWRRPQPLPSGLLPVPPFDLAFLPQRVAPWVADIAERMQCPLEFVAVPALVALGSALGRKVAIRPQARTDWIEVPNLWGCIVGRPGMMKSPAMGEALKPLHRLEAAARKAHADAVKIYETELELHKLRKDAAKTAARDALRAGKAASLPESSIPQEPKAKRFIVTDTTYEALGEILAGNPNGVLAFRDELVSLLKTLDREEYVAARGFFLTAWNGTSTYTFDRILRGRTHIEAACLSLLGSTQPGRIAEYIRRAVSGSASDDGLIQRFGLLVWPDQSGEWKAVDRFPDAEARRAAWATFEGFEGLLPEALGAERDQYDALPFLRFDATAQGVFAEWRIDLERRLRSGEMSPALESHLAKYRKLVPALSLINHLADGGRGAVTEAATLRALALAECLEAHARRAYAAGIEAETAAAKAVVSRIRKGELSDGFTLRDVHQKGWANLSDRDQVKAGLDLLYDLDWLAAKTEQTGGRPRTSYTINPEARA